MDVGDGWGVGVAVDGRVGAVVVGVGIAGSTATALVDPALLLFAADRRTIAASV